MKKLKRGYWYFSSTFDPFFDILRFYLAASGIVDVALVNPSWPYDRLFPEQSFNDFSKFILPLNVNDNHWILFFADRVKGTLQFYDSLGTAPPEDADVKRVHKFFDNFGVDSSKYSIEHVETFKQKNSSDCGPFTVAFSFFLASGMALSKKFFKHPADVRLFCTSILYETIQAYVTWSEQGKAAESGYEPELEGTTTDAAGFVSHNTDAEGLDVGGDLRDNTGI